MQPTLKLTSVYLKHTKLSLLVSLIFPLSGLGNPLHHDGSCIIGCHDNGYVTNLRSQITAGFKEKLILLPSYKEMAAGIAELELPVLVIPDLFLTQKLCAVLNNPIVSGGSPTLGSLPPFSRGFVQNTPAVISSENDESPDTIVPDSVAQPDISALRHPSTPITYSSVVQSGQKRTPIPDTEPNNTGSNNKDEAPDRHVMRHINPDIVSIT